MKKRAVNGFPDWDELPDWAKKEFENFVNKTYRNENRMNYEDDLIIVKTPSGDIAFKGLVDEGNEIYDDFDDFRFDEDSNMYIGNGPYSGWTVKVVTGKKAMKKRADYFDSMCMMTGYQPKTTFWSDFSIADAFGDSAIRDTFNRAFAEWKSDYIYLTELVMVLNWKSWQWNDRGDYARSELYVKLWEKADGYACDHLKGEELSYFFHTTD